METRELLTATAVFYEMNGYALHFGDRELYDWLIGLYSKGQVNKRSLDAWFRSHLEAL